MPFIIIVIVAIYIVAILWSWKVLGNIEKNKKIAVISIGIILMYLVTKIVFSISTKGVSYVNAEMLGGVSKIIVSLFVGINSMLLIPYIGRLLDKVNENEIEKDTFSKRIIALIIILVIVLWLECGYMTDMQQGIIGIYNAMK